MKRDILPKRSTAYAMSLTFANTGGIMESKTIVITTRSAPQSVILAGGIIARTDLPHWLQPLLPLPAY